MYRREERPVGCCKMDDLQDANRRQTHGGSLIHILGGKAGNIRLTSEREQAMTRQTQVSVTPTEQAWGRIPCKHPLV